MLDVELGFLPKQKAEEGDEKGKFVKIEDVHESTKEMLKDIGLMPKNEEQEIAKADLKQTERPASDQSAREYTLFRMMENLGQKLTEKTNQTTWEISETLKKNYVGLDVNGRYMASKVIETINEE